MDEYTKTKDIGKAAKKGALSAVASVGPLEGATLGATIGSAIPGVGTVTGAVVGGVIGGGIQLIKMVDPKFFDEPVKETKKVIKTTSRAIEDVKNWTTNSFDSFGKMVGFG